MSIIAINMYIAEPCLNDKYFYIKTQKKLLYILNKKKTRIDIQFIKLEKKQLS